MTQLKVPIAGCGVAFGGGVTAVLLMVATAGEGGMRRGGGVWAARRGSVLEGGLGTTRTGIWIGAEGRAGGGGAGAETGEWGASEMGISRRDSPFKGPGCLLGGIIGAGGGGGGAVDCCTGWMGCGTTL